MRKTRVLLLTVMLLVALALSACSTVLPSAMTGLNNLGSALNALAPQAQTAAPVSASNSATQAVAPAISVSDLQAALEQVYVAVNPSVVNIRVTLSAGSRQIQGLPGMPGGQSPFGQNTPDQGTMPRAMAEGSGFVWDKQGHIVTNNHVAHYPTQVGIPR